MAPSIRPVWFERLVCIRCGKEFCHVSGAIPGFVEMGQSAAPVQEADPDADPPLGFALFDGEKPVCLGCGGLLPKGGRSAYLVYPQTLTYNLDRFSRADHRPALGTFSIHWINFS